MSTAAAPAAGAATAPDAGATPPATPETKKIESVPTDIRRRILGLKEPPAETPEQKAAREKAEKEAADKKAADDAAAAKKKKDDEEAAARAASGSAATVDKVKKVKGGPPLPEQKPAAATNSEDVKRLVRDVMAEGKETPTAPTLDPEVQREIDLAAFAEKKNPERYAGMAAKVKTFFTSHDELLAEKSKEFGGAKSGEFKDWLESDEYKNWVASNRPSYTRGDKAKLAEDLIAERARAEARQELAPELKKLERKTAELEHAPVIRARTNEALKVIITDPNEQKDPALQGFAADPIKFGEEHPEEAQIIAAEASEAVELIEEVYRIDLDLVDFNPKAPTAKQAQIRNFVRGQNNSLRQQFPNGMEMKDGTILIDADTYAEKKLGADSRYRVFNADEIAGMLAATRNAVVLERLKKRREGITKSVYAPKVEAPAAAAGAQQTAKEDDPPSPGAGTRAAPGTAVKPMGDPYKEKRRKLV